MKLLLDENLSSAHAETLRALGHDAVSVVELGLGGQDDFANVIRHPTAGTPGVIRLRLHPATEQAIDAAIVWAMERLASVDVAGRLVVIDEHKIRIRG